MFNIIVTVVAGIIQIVVTTFFSGLVVYVALKTINNSGEDKNKRQLKNINRKAFYKEIPCFGDINIAYWLLYNYSNEDKQKLNNSLFGAYIFKWYKKGYIDIKKSKNILSKGGYDIYLNDGNWEKNYVENEIYKFLKEAAGNNNILEKNSIKNYCSVNPYEFSIKIILDKIRKELEEQKYITVESSKIFMLFNTSKKVILSEKLIEEYENLIGLKNFLQDSYNIEEKEDIDYHLREDYLAFASLLGIADKVINQFNKIDPDFNEMNNITLELLGNSGIGLFDSAKNKYKTYLLNFIGVPIIILIITMIMITFDKNREYRMLMVLMMIWLVIAIVLWIYNELKEAIITRKVNEMNSITYAKVTDTKVDYEREYDSDTGSYVTVTYYWTYYEYYVDDIKYTGCTRYGFKKRKGIRIKIYYNEMKPNRSESAREHNSNLIGIIVIAIVLVIMFASAILININ